MIRDSITGTLQIGPGTLLKTLQSIPEFQNEAMPVYEMIEWEPPMDSSDFAPEDWTRLAMTIGDNYYKYDGFVVLSGTDTMAYTASALSFMLENLAKPVVLTGAQVPLVEVYNDAKRNLIISMLIAANFDIPEVCLCFNNQLFRGNRAKKVDNWGIDAFASPNFPVLATMGTAVNLRVDLILNAPKRKFRVCTDFCSNIYVLHMIPGFDDTSLISFAEKESNKPKAMVIALYGTGNAPTRRTGFTNFVKKAISSGIVVVGITQCVRGAVNLGSYATGSALMNLGVIDGNDMTIEATVTKLGCLLGKKLEGEELRQAMTSNLRGELTPRELKYAGLKLDSKL